VVMVLLSMHHCREGGRRGGGDLRRSCWVRSRALWWRPASSCSSTRLVYSLCCWATDRRCSNPGFSFRPEDDCTAIKLWDAAPKI